MAFGLWATKSEGVGQILSVQLVSRISKPCGPDPPTSQMDRQMDNMQSQYRALHYSALRCKNDEPGRVR